MAMPGRKFNTVAYRYGMNGQEKDEEVFDGAMTADYWEYDTRTGRRWNADPITYTWQSPYACFNNNPIFFADPLGLEGDPPVGTTQKCEDGNTETFHKDGKWHQNNNMKSRIANFTTNDEYPGLIKETLSENYQYSLDKISSAKYWGYKKSSENLQIYLSGKGGTKIEDLKFLQSNGSFQGADDRLNGYLYNLAVTKGNALKKGESITFSNKEYVASISPILYATDLDYASGTSYIKANAFLTVSKSANNELSISIIAFKTWGDTYDWHPGLGVDYYYGDDEALSNLKAVGASDFRLRTYFMTILKSTYKTESIERGMQIKYQTYIPVLNVQTNQKLFHPIINTDNGYQEY